MIYHEWSPLDAFPSREMAEKSAKDVKKSYPRLSVKVKYSVDDGGARTPWVIFVLGSESNPARYKHKRLISPRKFARGSFRVKKISRRKKLIVACPKGKYKRGRCRVGMKAQAVLTRKNGNRPGLPLTDPRMAFHRPLSHEESREIAGGEQERAKQLLKTYRELTPFLRGGERTSPAMRAYAGTSEAAQSQLRSLYGLPPMSLIKTFKKIERGGAPSDAEKAAAKKWLKKNPPKIDLYSHVGKYLSSTKLHHSIRAAMAAWNRKWPYRPAGFGRYNPNPVCGKMKKHLRHDIKDFRSIERKVRGMRRDDERTIRRNPARRRAPIIIYDKTESITMQKGRGPYKGQRFIHNFSTKPTQYGIPAGTVVKYPDGRTFRMTTRSVMLSGKNHLWKKFRA